MSCGCWVHFICLFVLVKFFGEFAYLNCFTLLGIKHLYFRQILVWFPASKYQDFVLDILLQNCLALLLVLFRLFLDVVHWVHNETSFFIDMTRFSLDHFPTKVLVLKVESLNSFQGLTDFLFCTAEVLIPIDESLECVQISLVLRDECTRVASLFVHGWQWNPLVVEYIEFLTVSHHFIIFVASSNHVNKSVLEFIVSCKRGSTFRNGLQILDLVGQEVELENIGDGLYIGLRVVVVNVPWDDNNSVIWHVDGSSIFQRLVQLELLLIIGVGWSDKVPFGVWLRAVLAICHHLYDVFMH